MEVNYCPECGNKLDKNSIFCEKCGFKVRKENSTKFCSNCGEKIDVKAEICPKCGVRLMNPLVDTARDTFNKASDTTVKLANYITFKRVAIVFLIIIIIGLVICAPSIIKFLTPYKVVDEDYIANPTPGEKVQFDGEYIGSTNWNGGYLLPFSMVTENDIVQVGDQYVIIQGDYLDHHLSGHEGSTVHLEGRFASTEVSSERFADGYISGHWFGADVIEIVS